MIEQDLDSGYTGSIKRDQSIGVPTNHPYLAIVEYLKGKYYFKEEQWKKATKCFDQAIYLYDSYLGGIKYHKY